MSFASGDLKSKLLNSGSSIPFVLIFGFIWKPPDCKPENVIACIKPRAIKFILTGNEDQDPHIALRTSRN